jgi:hypothetical protein
MGNAELIESDHVDVVDAKCVESRSCFVNNVWYLLMSPTRQGECTPFQ